MKPTRSRTFGLPIVIGVILLALAGTRLDALAALLVIGAIPVAAFAAMFGAKKLAESAGAVIVGGTDLARIDEQARTLFRRRHVGFVFQFFNLIPLLTVEENLRLPLELTGQDDHAGRARARRLLERVGLADRQASYPEQLSGGEQQRLAVARALVHEPTLILADEPTGNLDADTAAEVVDLLEGLAREGRKTLVMVTHSREVVGVADRVLTVQHGRLVEG